MAWKFFDAVGSLKKQDVPTLVPMEPWHLVGAAGEPAFQNSWVNYGGAEEVVGFRKDPMGRVLLKGLAKSGTMPSAIFTLPVGYRPPTTARWPVIANDAFGYVYVLGNGAVVAQTGSNVFFDLGSVEFDTQSVLIPATPGIVPVVTALPTSPVHGQEIEFIADATNGVRWRLRYNAYSASAYKWEMVGGSDLLGEVVADQGFSSTTYVDLGTVGPDITVPLAGDYDLTVGATFYSGAANVNGLMSFTGTGLDNNVTPMDVRSTSFCPPGAFVGDSKNNRQRLRGLTAGALLRAKYRLGAATASDFRNRYLNLRPVRVG
jgi:hypothetical protein